MIYEQDHFSTQNSNSPCSCVNVPIKSLTFAYGSPVPSKISSHSCVVFDIVISSIQGSSRSRFSTRAELTANRSSLIHSGLPRPSHRRPKRRSVPPPKRISPSDVLNDLYGTTDATFISFLFLKNFNKAILTM